MPESRTGSQSTNDAALAGAVREALSHHQNGRVAEAYAIYQRLLSRHPAHPDLMNLAGAAALQMGDPRAARRYLEGALAARPDKSVDVTWRDSVREGLPLCNVVDLLANTLDQPAMSAVQGATRVTNLTTLPTRRTQVIRVSLGPA